MINHGVFLSQIVMTGGNVEKSVISFSSKFIAFFFAGRHKSFKDLETCLGRDLEEECS